MKRLAAVVTGLAICIGMAGQAPAVQAAGEPAPVTSAVSGKMPGPGSFDYDMQALRNSLAPGFTYDYGNWIQYFSGAAVWGLKACGVPGRTGWGQMAVADATGSVAAFVLSHGCKWAFDRVRPDGSRANSFPSGHTTTAFLTATWLQKEYGERLPWLCGIGYGVATLTAQQRILRNKHWTTDTMAGAVVGVISAEIGYWLSDIILGKHNYRFFDEFTYDTSLKYWEASYWYSRRLAFDGRHGAAAAMQVQAPLGPSWGIAARGAASNVDETRALLSAMAGAYYVRQVAPKAEVGAHVLAGAAWWDDNDQADGAAAHGWHAAGCGFDMVAGLSASCILTQSAKIRFIAEWETIPAAGWLNAINLGLGGSIYF